MIRNGILTQLVFATLLGLLILGISLAVAITFLPKPVEMPASELAMKVRSENIFELAEDENYHCVKVVR